MKDSKEHRTTNSAFLFTHRVCFYRLLLLFWLDLIHVLSAQVSISMTTSNSVFAHVAS